MPKELIADVYWEGPFDWEKRDENCQDYHVLYQIYGAHPVYGHDALLYIGLTNQQVGQRLKAHTWWVNELHDPVAVRLASVGEFTTWKQWNRLEHYDRADPELVRKIEALLIYVHKPAHNTQHKASVDLAKGIRIFNSGHFGKLLPELSYKYYWGK
jgi:hypothetical protein